MLGFTFFYLLLQSNKPYTCYRDANYDKLSSSSSVACLSWSIAVINETAPHGCLAATFLHFFDPVTFWPNIDCWTRYCDGVDYPCAKFGISVLLHTESQMRLALFTRLQSASVNSLCENYVSFGAKFVCILFIHSYVRKFLYAIRVKRTADMWLLLTYCLAASVGLVLGLEGNLLGLKPWCLGLGVYCLGHNHRVTNNQQCCCNRRCQFLATLSHSSKRLITF